MANEKRGTSPGLHCERTGMRNRREIREDDSCHLLRQRGHNMPKIRKNDRKLLCRSLDEHFENMVKEAGKGSRMWVQDGDPFRNSTTSREAMTRVNPVLLPIPPRSPDMNPIENFFGIVKARLKIDAIERNIEVETMDEFENRIRCIMKDIPLKTTNSIIESMNKRMKLIIANRGERLKY
eukprot:gene17686-biopygen6552